MTVKSNERELIAGEFGLTGASSGTGKLFDFGVGATSSAMSASMSKLLASPFSRSCHKGRRQVR